MSMLRRQQIEVGDDDSNSEEIELDNDVDSMTTAHGPISCRLTAASGQIENNLIISASESSSDTADEDGHGSSSSGEFSDISDASHETVHSSDECSVHSSVGSDISDDDEKIWVGSNITVDEAILKVLQVYIRERWTKTSLNSNVKLIKSLLPNPNLFPTSGRKLLSRLDDLSAYQIVKEHFYCSKCQEKKVNERDLCPYCIDCEMCKDKDDDIRKNCDCQKTGVFFEFSIEEQMRYMFEHRGLASAMDEYHREKKNQPECICDITDGTEYIKVRSKLNGRYDVVLLTSSDGVELSSSSKQEMWPILSIPCEVLPNRRPQYMVVSGVYVDCKKPNMNVFFKPFVDSLKNIYDKGGILWVRTGSEVSITSQIVSPVISADAPAKALILNVKNHNHRFGCNICEQKATRVQAPQSEETGQQTGRKKRRKKRVAQKVTVRRFVFTEDEAPLCTEDRMFALGELAERRGKSRKGVIGQSVVAELPLINRAHCLCAEYLHLVLLGVVKYFLNIMCNVSGPWSIKSHMKEIDLLIKSIKVPDFVKRLPRGLSDLKFYKGSELRSFLLFYSLPLLKQYLPSEYLQHWMLLVISINILLKDCISEDELKAAEIMLRCFVRDVGVLYHKKFYTYNVHNLLHLCTLVRRWGNLWATSAFHFESYNGFITSHVHGTKHLGKELLNNIRIKQSTKILEITVEAKDLRNNNKPVVEMCGSKLTEELCVEEQ
ncbi:S-adenosylmethionine decarboxylase proenzyme [Frankliniella fusca]|uniref:S-adenosylmethionine decarboxylase proenzyme n=1 Tax=Frankliniella fusca TaxID=407009 RepID=A0AAE1HTE5_9NEOP|nr:S-adenosylmethionine decarboxylase proenzyme [Frankliniella fusca]